MTLRQLQYVLAVAQLRSFRQAAEVCHVAQPSLSAQIAQVEDALGVQIFERDRRRVNLTPAGERLVTKARALLAQAEELAAAARQYGDPLAGQVRLGVIPTIGPYLLPEVAPRLRTLYPKLSFVWSEEKTDVLVAKLNRGELDGAILALEANLGDLTRLVLGRDPFVLATPAAHPLGVSSKPVKPQELEGQRVLLLDDGHCFRDQALPYCARAGAEEAGYRATSLSTLVQMAAGGAGVTLLPSLALPVENRNNTLKIREFAPKAPYRTIALVWRAGAAIERTLRPVGEALQKTYASL